ncbi:hypothetical protein K493DRAFT_69846 [Basidiobolus meristosporus CBS 931.73]|uniref:Uncharacterized protein n=1 Tax=Basidiobolus meristosporus CBS 931.73 TaxID=1314790 RepID=A0A1Y1XU66_9FUNG|nr:hypothetical protein K493DRAFT_69846 [Basidiobolus meristosporus CBS 931.73]|eukprot:ORX89302.1 hypothetical protein K493DRAFT_69846 [Basidiobolus meristosporus CBS 931.73]
MKLLFSSLLFLTIFFTTMAQNAENDGRSPVWDENATESISDMSASRGSIGAHLSAEETEKEDDGLQQTHLTRFGRIHRIDTDNAVPEPSEQESPDADANEDPTQPIDAQVNQTDQVDQTSVPPQPTSDIEVNDNSSSASSPTSVLPTDTSSSDIVTEPTISSTNIEFVNTPIVNPQNCIVLNLGQGPACLDPKLFGANLSPSSDTREKE